MHEGNLINYITVSAIRFTWNVNIFIVELDRAKLCLKVNYKEIVTTVKNDEIVQVLKHQNKLKKKSNRTNTFVPWED